MASHKKASNQPCPIILVRGFGGIDVSDEKKIAYQGFNDGTVYPHKRGENYIYEGLVLRFLKSHWAFHDATNVVGYYGSTMTQAPAKIPAELKDLDPNFFSGSKVVLDPAMALHLYRKVEDPCRTLWVFRYYDLDDRKFDAYGQALVRLIDFIRELAALKNKGAKPPVNIIAHSMGGLLVRQAVQITYPQSERHAADYINKIVTLGTPHQGISFQILKNWIKTEAAEEVANFCPEKQADEDEAISFKNFHKHFPLDRLLAVVGTNYRTYDVGIASKMNRFFSVSDEFGLNYNRSDGLVKQTYAQIPGAYRTFVHKCHGGFDSVVTSRESFEIATRFFFGNVKAKLRLVDAKVLRGKDRFGSSEFFFGVSIKPRRVDFDLFHQSAEAENCYGPFSTVDLSDPQPAFAWLGEGRLIWEGFLDTSQILGDPSITNKDMVIRLDFYVGERDLFGLGFSDNVIFRKQYYVRAVLTNEGRVKHLCSYSDESFAAEDKDEDSGTLMTKVGKEWRFEVVGTGFKGTLGLELEKIA